MHMIKVPTPKVKVAVRSELTRASEQGLTYTPGQCHRLIHKIVFKI